MKKFLTTMLTFVALALTACGGTPNTPSEEAKWETNNTHHWHINAEGEKVDNAKHEFEEDPAQAVAATCEQDGKKVEVCKVCGFVKESKITALGHDWDGGEITKEATCSVPGERTYHCKREGCTATKTEEIKADHVWGAAQAVTGEGADVDYNLFTCTVCGTKKIEFVAKQPDGKCTIDGSLKSDSTFPDYLKLGTNGNSISYSFNYATAGKAKVYMRGVMDYWHDGNNENQARDGYYAGKNSSDGNFELKVNDEVVDYSWSKGMTYEDLIPGEAQGTYSALADCLVGDCNIAAGPNTFVFKRTESYNLLIKDFVIIFDK